MPRIAEPNRIGPIHGSVVNAITAAATPTAASSPTLRRSTVEPPLASVAMALTVSTNGTRA